MYHELYTVSRTTQISKKKTKTQYLMGYHLKVMWILFIRIRIRNRELPGTDPDPGDQLSLDPGPT
jgi:hypothetical protein